MEIKRVLVPLDFSDRSRRAMDYGMELCRKFQAELHLLHILDVRIGAAPQFGMGLAVPHLEEESAEQAMRELESLPGDGWEGSVVRATAHGTPFDGIVNYSKQNEIDLIALGTHGRTGLSHVLLGSVAENVARHAPCPVLIVR